MSKPIPRELLTGGYSVAVRLPLGPDAIAHRPQSAKRKNSRRTPGSSQPAEVRVAVPACDPSGPAATEFTAAWADHHGAVACTEQACFPDA
jgi:hypothetical protein